MAIITFLSDFGTREHYVAAVKAKILSEHPDARLVDISHQIEPFNVAHGAYVLKAVYKDFPEGSIHLVAVNSAGKQGDGLIGLKKDGHYFLGVDNGFFSLIFDGEPDQIISLGQADEELFPSYSVLARVAAKLSKGDKLTSQGQPLDSLKRLLDRELRISDKMIMGNIIHIDHYGNLIANIDKETFKAASAERGFTVKVAREGITKIHNNYNEVDEGEIVVTFNSVGLLEIAINKGNASQLLGLRYDSPLIVSFQ